jgi:hypothetical protein
MYSWLTPFNIPIFFFLSFTSPDNDYILKGGRGWWKLWPQFCFLLPKTLNSAKTPCCGQCPDIDVLKIPAALGPLWTKLVARLFFLHSRASSLWLPARFPNWIELMCQPILYAYVIFPVTQRKWCFLWHWKDRGDIWQYLAQEKGHK